MDAVELAGEVDVKSPLKLPRLPSAIGGGGECRDRIF